MASTRPCWSTPVTQRPNTPAPQPDSALKLYQQSLHIRDKLAQAEPDRADYQRDLSISYNKLGDLYRALGQGEQALKLYQQSLHIANKLAQAEPADSGVMGHRVRRFWSICSGCFGAGPWCWVGASATGWLPGHLLWGCVVAESARVSVSWVDHWCAEAAWG